MLDITLVAILIIRDALPKPHYDNAKEQNFKQLNYSHLQLPTRKVIH
jgi:hypothetical protein